MDDARLNAMLKFASMNEDMIPDGYGEEMEELIRLGYIMRIGDKGPLVKYRVTEYGREVLREGGIAMARKRKEAEEKMRMETVDCAKESNRIASEANKIAVEANRIASESTAMARKANIIAIVAIVISLAGLLISLLVR